MKTFLKLIGAAIEHKRSKGYKAKVLVRNYAYFDILLWMANNNVSIRICHPTGRKRLYYYCELEYKGEKVVCEHIEECVATAQQKWSL